MYSPTTRLLTILELLQAHRQMSGGELARRLEVHPRTVRRYITMLQDMGIPVEAERGPYGGYRLRRGYKMPPLMFTDDEAVATTLGLMAIREFRFPVNVVAVEGALAKTERVMPLDLFERARGLQEALTFKFLQPPVQPLENDSLALLSLAVRRGQTVNMRYLSWHGRETERRFDPYGIVVNEGYWYASGYCHLRQDLRTFRLDRIVGLQALDLTFERPPDFDTLHHVLDSLATMPGAAEVAILFQASLEEVQEHVAPELGSLEETPQGVLFRRAASDVGWLAHFLLWFDLPMVILQPPELRQTMRQLAARALRMAGDDAP